MSVDRSRRGEQVLEGKVTPPNTDPRIGKDDEEHRMMMRFFEPSFDETLKEVCAEVFEMRSEGKLRPFVEGEPIGAYKKLKQPRKYTAAEVREYHEKRRVWAREEMLALRHQNNLALKRYGR